MSGGLNRLFLDDPVAFFERYNVYGGNMAGGGVPPVPFPGVVVGVTRDVNGYTAVFDFVAVAGNATRVRLDTWAERMTAPRPETFMSRRITAYFLPQCDGEATTLTVRGWGTNHFFTTQLTGCRVAVTNQINPVVAHIAVVDAVGGVLNQDAFEATALAGLNNRRHYDSGTMAAPAAGLSADYRGTGFVFGYRPFPGQAWRFYGQTHGTVALGANDELPKLSRLL